MASLCFIIVETGRECAESKRFPSHPDMFIRTDSDSSSICGFDPADFESAAIYANHRNPRPCGLTVHRTHDLRRAEQGPGGDPSILRNALRTCWNKAAAIAIAERKALPISINYQKLTNKDWLGAAARNEAPESSRMRWYHSNRRSKTRPGR